MINRIIKFSLILTVTFAGSAIGDALGVIVGYWTISHRVSSFDSLLYSIFSGDQVINWASAWLVHLPPILLTLSIRNRWVSQHDSPRSTIFFAFLLAMFMLFSAQSGLIFQLTGLLPHGSGFHFYLGNALSIGFISLIIQRFCTILKQRLSQTYVNVANSRIAMEWAIRFLNWVIAIAYGNAGMNLIYRLVANDVPFIGSLVLAIPAFVQTYGHIRLRSWAAKITTTILGVVTFLALLFLIPGYESIPLPPHFDRVCLVIFTAFLTSISVWNYIHCEQLEQATLKNNFSGAT